MFGFENIENLPTGMPGEVDSDAVPSPQAGILRFWDFVIGLEGSQWVGIPRPDGGCVQYWRR